jgi:hypothetical protein
MSFCTSFSSKRRPIRRLTAYRVFFGVGDGLALGRGAAQDFAVFGVGDDRRRGARAFGVFDDLRLAAFHDGNAGVGGAEVDADDLAHFFPFDEFEFVNTGFRFVRMLP